MKHIAGLPVIVRGSQPPRWCPVIPASWYLGPCVVFHTEEGWLTQPVDCYRNDRMWLPRWGHKSHCHLCLLLLDDLLQGKLAAMSWGHSWSPTERSMWWRTESSCQKPREWASLEVDSPLPAKPSDDCSHSQHFNCNFMKDAEPATPSYAAPDPWPSETGQDSTYRLFQATELGSRLLHSIGIECWSFWDGKVVTPNLVFWLNISLSFQSFVLSCFPLLAPLGDYSCMSISFSVSVVLVMSLCGKWQKPKFNQFMH